MPTNELKSKTACFLGVLYPAKQLLWQIGSDYPTEALNSAAKIVANPDFWDGIEATSKDLFGLTIGRFVESLVNDGDIKRLTPLLACAVLGLTSNKFLWLKVEESEIKPIVAEGKKLEAAFNIEPRFLEVSTVLDARKAFFENWEVALGAEKMWYLKEHEWRPLVRK